MGFVVAIGASAGAHCMGVRTSSRGASASDGPRNSSTESESGRRFGLGRRNAAVSSGGCEFGGLRACGAEGGRAGWAVQDCKAKSGIRTARAAGINPDPNARKEKIRRRPRLTAGAN